MSVPPRVCSTRCCVLLLPVFAFTYVAGGTGHQRLPALTKLELAAARIKSSFGVQVHYSYDVDTYFPSNWKKPPLSAEGRQIDLNEAARTMPIIEAFLSKYPPQLIASNLRDIFLLRDLSFCGKAFGATYSGSGVYITNSGELDGYSTNYLEAIMHAEFSSILFNNYDFPAKEWSQVNEKGWEYVGLGEDYSLLKRADLLEQREDLLDKGFLNKYAQASIEEDFNTYVSHMVEDGSQLLNSASRHTRVAQKIQIVFRFYKTLGSAFPSKPPEARQFSERLSKAENGSRANGSQGNVSQTSAALPELPFDVFARPPYEAVIVTVPGRSRITIKGQSTIRVIGPTTITIREPGPITVTVEPEPSGE